MGGTVALGGIAATCWAFTGNTKEISVRHTLIQTLHWTISFSFLTRSRELKAEELAIDTPCCRPDTKSVLTPAEVPWMSVKQMLFVASDVLHPWSSVSNH
jgi:hypothetical protein